LAVPILEIALFIQVGGLIGLWPTLGLVVLSAALGLAVMRTQGVEALRRLQAKVLAGEDPSGPIAHGALLMIAGVLLLVPGFFTSALGLVLLVPAARSALIRWAAGGLRARSVVFMRRARPAGGVRTIEADYEVLDDVPPAERGASGWTRPQS
jgi:UPF0716 protein FxsA